MSLPLAFVLEAMALFQPGHDAQHEKLAQAISVVSEDTPLFSTCKDAVGHTISDPAECTAAWWVAVTFRESSFNNEAVGDHGHAVCSAQIYDGPKALLSDPEMCLRTATVMMKQSIRIDPQHPLAFYARGPRYLSHEACRLSDDRQKLAAWVLFKLPDPVVTASE